MKIYRSTATVEFFAGVVAFKTERQYNRRKHIVEPVGDGRFRIIEGQKLCFKAGEEFGLEFDPGKAMEMKLELIYDPDPETEPETDPETEPETDPETEPEPVETVPKKRGPKPKQKSE